MTLPFRFRTPHAVLLAALAAAACDVPTKAPTVQSQLLIPVSGDSVSVNTLLPSSVGIAGNSLVAVFAPWHSVHPLSQLCAQCTVAVRAPKPAFTGSVTDTVVMPASVRAATLASPMTVSIALTHNFGFDPTQPSATARGSLVLTLSANGTVIATDTFHGETPWIRGSSLVRTLTVPAGAVVAGPLVFKAVLTSPAGDTAVVDPNSALTVDVPTTTLAASSMAAVLTAQPLPPLHFFVNTSGVGPNPRSHIKGGVLTLAIANPVSASGTVTLNFTGGATSITPRTITLSGRAADSAQVTFSEQEMQSLIAGSAIQVTTSGTVSGSAADHVVNFQPGGWIRVTPQVTVTVSY